MLHLFFFLFFFLTPHPSPPLFPFIDDSLFCQGRNWTGKLIACPCSTRARVARAFRDHPEADQVKEVLALLPVSRTLSDVQAKEKFLAELTPGAA
jgi:hypothetical protein